MSPAVKRAYFKIFVEGEEEVGDVKDFFENRETILAAVAIVAFVGEALSAYKKLPLDLIAVVVDVSVVAIVVGVSQILAPKAIISSNEFFSQFLNYQFFLIK